jgi:hypothetical protein
MTWTFAMGGSTNTILHLLAIAQEAEIDFTMADIDRMSRIVPQLCKVAPNTNKYHIEDVHRAGGIMGILGELDRAGKLHTDVPTVHSKTMKDALDAWDIPQPQRRGRQNLLHGRARRHSHAGGLQPEHALAQPGHRPRRRLHPLGEHAFRKKVVWPCCAATLRWMAAWSKRPGWTTACWCLKAPPTWCEKPGRGRGRHPGRQGQGRRCGGRALRRPQRRPRHAGNALPHQLHQVQRPGQSLCAADRWALLWRHIGPVDWPRVARSGGGRCHRPGAQRRHHSH